MTSKEDKNVVFLYNSNVKKKEGKKEKSSSCLLFIGFI
jgi:hypothetical protein